MSSLIRCHTFHDVIRFGSSDGSDTAEAPSSDSIVICKQEAFSAPADGATVTSGQRGRSRSVGGIGKPGDMANGRRRFSPVSSAASVSLVGLGYL